MPQLSNQCGVFLAKTWEPRAPHISDSAKGENGLGDLRRRSLGCQASRARVNWVSPGVRRFVAPHDEVCLTFASYLPFVCILEPVGFQGNVSRPGIYLCFLRGAKKQMEAGLTLRGRFTTENLLADVWRPSPKDALKRATPERPRHVFGLPLRDTFDAKSSCEQLEKRPTPGRN